MRPPDARSLAAALLGALAACGGNTPPVVTGPPVDGGAQTACVAAAPSPAGASPARAGASASSSGLFVASVAPQYGMIYGADTVLITGGGFAPGDVVAFGTLAALTCQILDPSNIAALTPPSPAGSVTVTVIAPDGSSAVAPVAFTFEEPQ